MRCLPFVGTPIRAARNLETIVGQHWHGNNPDHEAPFAYHFIGRPDKSQQVTAFMLDSLFGMGPLGPD